MKIIGKIIWILMLVFSFQNEKEKVTRMNQPTFFEEITKETSLIVSIKDTIDNNTLIVYTGIDNNAVKYSRNIITGVCIDGKCRMVKINLFWNITGTYLGFELPEGEFLSKTEHVKFNSKEYDQLHQLLSNNQSALANYELKELVPEIDSSRNKIDALSSATIDAVLDYIVEDAVYTTYTLWHIVYGPTKNAIEKQTSEKLNSELVLKILASNNLKDQVWVLNHIPAKMDFSSKLFQKLIELISGNDIYLAERSLNAIKPESLSDEIQLELAKTFQSSGFLQKRLIIQKLKETDNLNTDAVPILSAELNGLNATLTKSLLELYQIHLIQDTKTIAEVSQLLKHKNRYISNEAFRYLQGVSNLNKKTKKAVDKFYKSNF